MRDFVEQHNCLQNRRRFLKTSGMGLGVTALASLLPQNRRAQAAPHITPRAKHVIFLFMARFVGLWLQGYMSNAKISFFDLIGMYFRKVDARTILTNKIALVQANIRGIETRDLEAH